jgi:hypothetical protein
MSDDKDFQVQMDLFLRRSPLIPPLPTRCVDCSEFHIIADDLVYCVQCSYPIAGEKIKLESSKQELSRRGFLSILLGK